MPLSPKQKKDMSDFRKWVKTQRRRYRIGSYPSFSYSCDDKTNNLMLCYSVNEVIGFNKKNGEKYFRNIEEDISSTLTSILDKISPDNASVTIPVI